MRLRSDKQDAPDVSVVMGTVPLPPDRGWRSRVQEGNTDMQHPSDEGGSSWFLQPGEVLDLDEPTPESTEVKENFSGDEKLGPPDNPHFHIHVDTNKRRRWPAVVALAAVGASVLGLYNHFQDDEPYSFGAGESRQPRETIAIEKIDFTAAARLLPLSAAFTAEGQVENRAIKIDGAYIKVLGVPLSPSAPDIQGLNTNVEIGGTTVFILPLSALSQQRTLDGRQILINVDLSQVSTSSGLTPGKTASYNYYNRDGEKVKGQESSWKQFIVDDMVAGDNLPGWVTPLDARPNELRAKLAEATNQIVQSATVDIINAYQTQCLAKPEVSEAFKKSTTETILSLVEALGRTRDEISAVTFGEQLLPAKQLPQPTVPEATQKWMEDGRFSVSVPIPQPGEQKTSVTCPDSMSINTPYGPALLAPIKGNGR